MSYRDSYRGGGGRNQADNKNEFSDLLVFGYSCRVYPNDDKAEYIAEERHLIPWNGDEETKIDRIQAFSHGLAVADLGASTNRYDCRLQLESLNGLRAAGPAERGCPAEEMEESMCDEERYRDLLREDQRRKEEEEKHRNRAKKAEFGFSYDSTEGAQRASTSVLAEDSDSEDEPYQPPPGIKLPVGLEVPENEKQSHIIDRTAIFVVQQGAQMEIVIKAKQRGNLAMFGFLEFDNVLNPYYKYIMKLIREKKYMPDLNKKRKKKGVKQAGPAVGGALAALAAAHASDSDSDSDCELHPSLLGGRKETGPDQLDIVAGSQGPRQKPPAPPPHKPKTPQIKSDYKLHKANDMYASLFKSLSGFVPGAEKEQEKEQEVVVVEEKPVEQEPEKPPAAAAEKRVAAEEQSDEPFRAWYASFYGFDCPWLRCPAVVPPPPDMMVVVDSYAEFIAHHGASAEYSLRGRLDLNLEFLQPTHTHYPYYLQKLRHCQWLIHNPHAAAPPTVPVPPIMDLGAAPPPPLNRRQRRMGFQNAPKVAIAQVGVVNPLLAVGSSIAVGKEQEKEKEGGEVQERTEHEEDEKGAAEETSAPTPMEDGKEKEEDDTQIPKTTSVPTLLSSLAVSDVKEENTQDEDEEMEEGEERMQEEKTEQPVEKATPPPTLVPVSVPSPPVVPSPVPQPISFTINPMATPSVGACASPGLATMTSGKGSYSTGRAQLPPVPLPPDMSNNVQLDRKEKAKLFMEKILWEKREKARKEQEQMEQRRIEAEKARIEEELRKLEEEEKAAKKRERERRDSPSTSGKPKLALSSIDQLINSKIDAMLQREGLAQPPPPATPPPPPPPDETEERKKRRKKEKKRDDDRDRKKRRKRSRSRSRDRGRSRSRSGSRDRHRRRH